MEGFANLHKSKPAKFYDLNIKRQDASVQLQRRRKYNRTEHFNLRRNIPEMDDKGKANEYLFDKSKRKLALKKYQGERVNKRNKEIENKKPPFVVGIPHHGSSPILRNIANLEGDICNHTQKNEEVSFHPPRIFSVKKLTSPHTPTVLKRSVKKIKTNEDLKPSHQVRCNLYSRHNNVSTDKNASNDYEELLAIPLPLIETVGKEHNLADFGKVVMRKNKAGKKCSHVNKEPLKIQNKPQSERKTGHGNISDTFGANFQRMRLKQETVRLTNLAQKWQAISQLSSDLPSDAVDDVDSVVGQTRLLVNNKFNQFQKLIEEYESKTGSQIITSEDLNGFWDMMYLQVNDLTKRYEELERLKNNDWIKQNQSMRNKRGRPFKLKLKTGAAWSIKDVIKSNMLPSDAFALSSDEIRTPSRNSLRILGKTLTPIKPAYCIVCQSPLDSNHCCESKTKSTRSVKSSQKVTDQVTSEPSDSSDLSLEQKLTKCKETFSQHSNKRLKKNITCNFESGISKTPLRRSERKRTCVLDKLNDKKTRTEVFPVGYRKSGRTIRSGNEPFSRSDIFTSNVVEKTYMKRAPTPFVKRGARYPDSSEDSCS